MPKNAQTTSQLHSSHMLAKQCSEFSKPGFNSPWTMNFQKCKLDLEKAEEPEIILPTSVGSLRKQDSSRKTSALLTMPMLLTVWITTNGGIFLKRWEYQTTWPASWEICMQVKKQQLELDMEQWTGSKLGEKDIKAVYCHPVYLTYIQSIMRNTGLDEAQTAIKITVEISITSDMQMTPPLWQKVKRNQRASWWRW